MRKLSVFLLAFAATLLLFGGLGASPAALAFGSVRIQDDANVLSAADRQRVTTAAQNAPFNVTVWTTTAYADKTAFISAVQGQVGSDGVVIGLDPAHRYSHISAKSNTGLTAAGVNQADALANTSFGNKDWAGGIVNAISSLASAAPASGGAAPATNPLPAPANNSPLSGFSLGSCLIPLLIVGVIAFFLRNRFRSNRAPMGIPPQGPYQQNPGPYQQNQGPYQQGQGGYGVQPGGYYGGQQGGGGLGNVASGGLGALAGGAIGYELGRHGADLNPGAAQPGGYAPATGNGGGIIDSSSGSGPDFGGGSSGGGADFGSSGGFGGGGADFGGGGGGADFGGGGGGGGGGDIV